MDSKPSQASSTSTSLSSTTTPKEIEFEFPTMLITKKSAEVEKTQHIKTIAIDMKNVKYHWRKMQRVSASMFHITSDNFRKIVQEFTEGVRTNNSEQTKELFLVGLLDPTQMYVTPLMCTIDKVFKRGGHGLTLVYIGSRQDWLNIF
jgi:hypothetical protein